MGRKVKRRIIDWTVGITGIFCFLIIGLSVMDYMNSIQNYWIRISVLGFFSFSLPIFSGSFVGKLEEDTFNYLAFWGLISLAISEILYFLNAGNQIFIFWIIVVVLSATTAYKK